MAAPRGPTWHLRGVIYILLLLYSIKFFSLAYMGRIIELHKLSGIINPTELFIFFLCGTKVPHSVSTAGHVERGEALDRDQSAPIEWTRGPRIKIKTTCLFKQVITALISCDVAASHTSDQRRGT